MSNHTPTPWIRYGGGKRRWSVGRAGGGYCICQMTQNDEAAANAAHVVRCVNSHDDLLAACEKAYAALGKVPIKLEPTAPGWQEPIMEAFAELRTAIAKAKVKA